jgi:hypothetical protein
MMERKRVVERVMKSVVKQDVVRIIVELHADKSK